MTPLERALLSLDGLSVGDAFGDRFFGPHQEMVSQIRRRRLPPPPWDWTDDTAMALSVVDCLRTGAIDPDELAQLFARRYTTDPKRGYGGTAHSILRAISDGMPWAQAAGQAFDGMGSHGNGAAMRVAPIGAYFADDLERALSQARLSAQVTHAHPEGQAGALAVAAAAVWACNRPTRDGRDLIRYAWEHAPDGETRSRLGRALKVSLKSRPEHAGAKLGTGNDISAMDTVPFCIWCAARHLDDFVEAMWCTVSALGDRDTTCAIVGGIVALSAGVPAEWVVAREGLKL